MNEPNICSTSFRCSQSVRQIVINLLATASCVIPVQLVRNFSSISTHFTSHLLSFLSPLNSAERQSETQGESNIIRCQIMKGPLFHPPALSSHSRAPPTPAAPTSSSATLTPFKSLHGRALERPLNRSVPTRMFFFFFFFFLTLF